MSYTYSQKKALRSDVLCLVLCVFALCVAFHTVSVNIENELQYQMLEETPSAQKNGAQNLPQIGNSFATVKPLAGLLPVPEPDCMTKEVKKA